MGFFHGIQPLVNSHNELERSTMFYGQIHDFNGHVQVRKLFVWNLESGKQTISDSDFVYHLESVFQIPGRLGMLNLESRRSRSIDPQFNSFPA